jgi:uncharacterized cupin superfamily protein
MPCGLADTRAVVARDISGPRYVCHYDAEALLPEGLRVLQGLRTAEGWRELAEGEIAAFPVGDRGTHQVMNRSGEAVRVLIVSEMVAPEVLIYPDSGKLGAATRAPGATGEGGMWFFRRDDAVGNFEGEPMPGEG